MKTLFLTVSDRLFYSGTLAAINSLFDHVTRDFEIHVINSGLYNVPLSQPQIDALESHPRITVHHWEEFAESNLPKTLGAWQLKAYAPHYITKNRNDFDLLIGFDSDLFFADSIQSTIDRALASGKFMGGKDGDVLTYDESYAPYGFEVPTTTDKYMSSSCYFCPLTSENRAILRDWAKFTDEACYGPQEKKTYPGHGDQGVLNAVIHAHNAHENVELLPNQLWSQHWTFENDVLEWDGESLVNHSAEGQNMKTVHCGGTDKFWLESHSIKRRTEGMSQRWAYAMWLRYLFMGEIAPWDKDPMLVICPQSKHLFADLIYYHQLIRHIMLGQGRSFYDQWESLPWNLFDRVTKCSDQHRMMTLCGEGSMDQYAELVSLLPDRSTVVEVGSYLGGSISTLAMMNLHKKHHFYSVESFMGNRDNTVDGWPLPSIESYLANVKGKWPFLNINSIQLPSELAFMEFEEGSIDFLFIDGGHSEEDVLRDLELWASCVRVGGIIAGDDYSWDGVHAAVSRYLPNHKNKNGIWWAEV